jgi:hypothetical protein
VQSFYPETFEKKFGEILCQHFFCKYVRLKRPTANLPEIPQELYLHVPSYKVFHRVARFFFVQLTTMEEKYQ